MRIALVVGGADGGWDEWSRALALLEAAGATKVHVAVSGAGMEYPDPLHHWATLHPTDFGPSGLDFEARRAATGPRGGYVRWSLSPHEFVDRRVRTRGFRGGSSGLLGFDVALHGIGCAGAIGCGIRLDATPNRYNPRSANGWSKGTSFRPSWDRLEPRHRARMRCMSGWTRELLGAPTLEWIDGIG